MNTAVSTQSPDPLRPLLGKRAIVTGAGRGISAAIAIALVKAGADVAVNDLTFPKDTLDACTALGVRAIPAIADVGNQTAVDGIVDTVSNEFEGLDGGIVLPYQEMFRVKGRPAV